MKSIQIENARLHNLKNIDVEIPKDKLVAITGVSGSGKSTLIFDILFEESRSRFLQSVGSLQAIRDEEACDRIKGMCPVIAFGQRTVKICNPRSVVGTHTKIFDYLRSIFLSEGYVTCLNCGKSVRINMSCSHCSVRLPRVDSGDLNFNTAKGMCPVCKGRGTLYRANLNVVIDNKEKGIDQLCSGYLRGLKKSIPYLQQYLNIDLNTPYSRLTDDVIDIFLNGTVFPNGQLFEGVIPYMDSYIKRIASFTSAQYHYNKLCEVYDCPECQGYRVEKNAQLLSVHGKHIGQLGKMSISELKLFFEEYKEKTHYVNGSGSHVESVLNQLQNLIDVGLGHLSLYRELPTLSGGEAQRLSMVAMLNCKLDSVMYVFDEPTCGLHESEKHMLLNKFYDLKKMGNSVVIVEHDQNVIQNVEHIIDFGPYGGINGGQVVFQGDYNAMLTSDTSITGKFFSGIEKIPLRKKNYGDSIPTKQKLTLRNASTNNLKNISVEFPLGVMIGIAGVSGSGKSSLISDTLVPLLKVHFSNKPAKKDNLDDEENPGWDQTLFLKKAFLGEIDGLEFINGYAEILQEPIGRNRTSIPVTYMNIWGKIRTIFAGEPLAKSRGYTSEYFSFNSSGACRTCGGKGYERIWIGESMMTCVCQECKGKRYNPDLLDITYRGKNIHDILEMSVAEALDFFKEHKSIMLMLKAFYNMGMGYIKLGQPTPSLSGGEAQRLKLAEELGKGRKNKILYILDEPTTGLSLYDTSKLVYAMDNLVKEGNTVLIAEHDVNVLSNCDWIIELGPKGGPDGGEIIACGTPVELSVNTYSKIGPYLHV